MEPQNKFKNVWKKKEAENNDEDRPPLESDDYIDIDKKRPKQDDKNQVNLKLFRVLMRIVKVW